MSLSEKIGRRVGRTVERALAPRAAFIDPAKRSDSHNGLYPELCLRAALDPRTFNTFRRSHIYRAILEHVSEAQGRDFLEIIQRRGLTDQAIEAIRALNAPGSPTLYPYPTLGHVSPTALRYAKVAQDLIALLPKSKGLRIAEIGAGFGGQALVCDCMMDVASYDMFDLFQVNMLIQRFLEAHGLTMTYRLHVLSQYEAIRDFDLVISNYAFSELPRPLQDAYMAKVVLRSKHGYMTMNSNPDGRADRLGSYGRDELLAAIPGSRVEPEEPKTGPHNYILSW